MAKPRAQLKITLDERQLGENLMWTLTAADLLGRARVIEELHSAAAEESPVRRAASLLKVNQLPAFAELLISFDSGSRRAAAEFLRNKVGMVKRAFLALAQRYRLSAFTIAKVEKLMLIETAKEALAEAIEKGLTREEFIDFINQEFDRAGVTRLNFFHLQTVFETNVNTAYSIGRFQQLKSKEVTEALPFWRSVTMGDSRVRPTHRAMHGFIARHDDPVWREWYPPAGFRCRCVVVALTRRQAAESGQDLSKPGRQRLPKIDGRPVKPDEGFGGLPPQKIAQIRSLEKGA